jgi:chitinase
VIYRNGVATVSSSVTLLLYWNHLVYQQNSYGGWWDWVNGGWVATTDTRVAPAPAPTADTQAPTVAISSPGNGSVFNRRSTITASATASDNVGVKQVDFYLNGNLRCSSTTAPYSCAISLPGTRGWTGTLQVKASDTAGNVGSSSVNISTQ